MNDNNRQAFIIWKDEYSVQNEDIDKQHLEFSNILNKLYNAIQTQEQEEITEELIEQLIDYAGKHLKYEVELMKKVEYPEIESHIKHHNKFQNNIEKLKIQHSSHNNNCGS